MKKRDLLHAAAVKSKTSRFDSINWDRFRAARNMYKSTMRKKMKNYYSDKTASYFGSSKKFWTFYKSVVKTKKISSLSSVKNIKIDGKTICDKKALQTPSISSLQTFDCPLVAQ